MLQIDGDLGLRMVEPSQEGMPTCEISALVVKVLVATEIDDNTPLKHNAHLAYTSTLINSTPIYVDDERSRS